MVYVACLRVWDPPYSEMYHSQVLVRYFSYCSVFQGNVVEETKCWQVFHPGSCKKESECHLV